MLFLPAFFEILGILPIGAGFFNSGDLSFLLFSDLDELLESPEESDLSTAEAIGAGDCESLLQLGRGALGGDEGIWLGELAAEMMVSAMLCWFFGGEGTFK